MDIQDEQDVFSFVLRKQESSRKTGGADARYKELFY